MISAWVSTLYANIVKLYVHYSLKKNFPLKFLKLLHIYNFVLVKFLLMVLFAEMDGVV